MPFLLGEGPDSKSAAGNVQGNKQRLAGSRQRFRVSLKGVPWTTDWAI